MATIVEELLHDFNSLEGVTIAERKKNFFKLLHRVAPLLKNNTKHLDLISSYLKANSSLDDLFKVDFLIYFRRTSELLQLLKDGNSIFISKVAKESWFFKEAFNGVLADQLVNEFLPCMSYSVRMKVLRKLSRYTSCEKFEQIYDALVTRYGIYLTSRFITGCGPDKVRHILTEYPIKLTSTQLRILYDKDPELIDFYFIHSTYSFHDSCYKGLIKFIFSKNRDYFDYLKLKYTIPFKYGRRASKKFVAGNKDAIINDPHNFDYLDMKAIVRKIGKDSVKLFSNALRGNISTSLTGLQILNSFPKKYHYSLFFNTYQGDYNITFKDHPELINEKLLKMIPESASSERAILARVKVDEGGVEYLKYLPINDSVPLIKEKINLTSDIYERGILIKYLVETCHINNDFNALLSVMKYFCLWHKDDDLHVHLLFIDNIETVFGFKNFTEEMWNSMNELLMMHMLKFDENDATYQNIHTIPLLSFNVGISVEQKLSYLEFLFKKGEQIDELIREYFTSESEYPKYGKYEKNFEQYFLLFVINNLSKESQGENDLDFNVTVISEIDKWNNYHKDDQLSFYDFPVLLNTFNYVITHYKSNYDWSYIGNCVIRIFRNNIFTTQPNTYRDEYLQVYWCRVENFLSLDDIKWFLKYDPLIIVANFETVFDELHEFLPEDKGSHIWFIIKKFRHLRLDEKFIEKCLAKLNEDDPNVMKAKYIRCLSVLMKPNDFVALANSYKPTNKPLDFENEKEVTLYQLQCSIAAEFKNTQSYEVLWSLFNYCAGNYLKFAVSSLYSLLYRTPENMLPQYLTYLSEMAVSPRKHALFMTCELSTLISIENMLRFLNKQDEVLSLQKHMFAIIIQYFVKNPTDSFFELVKLNMLFITNIDIESLFSIGDHLSNIPQKYKIPYILHAWEHFDETVEIWETLESLKTSLLVGMNDEVVKEIPLDWGLGIIQQHFMTENNATDLSAMTDFIFMLVWIREDRSVIFEKIFTLLDQCKKQHMVFKFLHNWHNRIMESDCQELKYFNPYVNYFEGKINPHERFSDYIRVFFLKIQLEFLGSLPIDDLALKVVTFFEEVSAEFGQHITQLFAKEMDSNFSRFVARKSINKLQIYYDMIRQRAVPSVAILLLYVIWKPCETDRASRKIFDKIFQQMKRIEDLAVQITLLRKFKN